MKCVPTLSDLSAARARRAARRAARSVPATADPALLLVSALFAASPVRRRARAMLSVMAEAWPALSASVASAQRIADQAGEMADAVAVLSAVPYDGPERRRQDRRRR